jgi:hypothetical protein
MIILSNNEQRQPNPADDREPGFPAGWWRRTRERPVVILLNREPRVPRRCGGCWRRLAPAGVPCMEAGGKQGTASSSWTLSSYVVGTSASLQDAGSLRLCSVRVQRPPYSVQRPPFATVWLDGDGLKSHGSDIEVVAHGCRGMPWYRPCLFGSPSCGRSVSTSKNW